MHIIHTIPAISNEASGPSYSVVRLCETVSDQGPQITLAALDWAAVPSAPSCYRAFPVGLGPGRLGRSPALKRWLMSQARDGKADLIHNHGMWQMNSVYPGIASRRFGIPLMVSPRGTFSAWAFSSGSWIKRCFWPYLQLPALEVASCFHATALSEYEDIRKRGFQQPVAVIPNGIDVPPWKERSATGFRTLLFLGRVHPVKGVDTLLRAWGAVQDQHRDWQLRIVGDDAGFYGSSGYLAEMWDLSRSLGLERVQFSGALYGEEKWQAYSDAELFVLPSRSENFGMSVTEAMAAGTPALVSHGAPWAQLEAEGAGKWFECGLDPLVGALEQMLSLSSSELSMMGKRGRAWMERDYSWHGIGQQMVDVYNWMLGRSSLKPSCVRLN